ncbi:hypothetical protein [Aquimarina algiphila]|uniref:hypothetical protein n=1 Tax=Aquimarina algiphila TaxID=2047982 RepID=UPI00232D599F|nr:hypothetical protein [Aquimarina algiphila]
MADQRKSIGRRRNTLLQYRAVMEEFKARKTEDIPTTVIHRKYIYPKFFISRTTLYNILCTPVNKELKEIEEQQLSLF